MIYIKLREWINKMRHWGSLWKIIRKLLVLLSIFCTENFNSYARLNEGSGMPSNLWNTKANKLLPSKLPRKSPKLRNHHQSHCLCSMVWVTASDLDHLNDNLNKIRIRWRKYNYTTMIVSQPMNLEQLSIGLTRIPIRHSF